MNTKICIVGSTGHINYVLEGVRNDEQASVVGIAPGPEEEGVNGLLGAFSFSKNPPREFDGYEKMLKEMDPDVVVVACHFNNHARISTEALGRDLHVFVEKPVATTLEDLDSVKKAYEDSDSFLATMFGIRYRPTFSTAKKIVEGGAIGEIRLMNAQKSYILGERGEHYRKRESYGGTIPWVGSHAIDWLHWFSGREFKSVFASQSREYNRGHGDLESTALCHFVLADEVLGNVTIDYLRPEEAPSHGDDRLRLVGSRGVLEVRDERVFLINDEIEGVRRVPLRPVEKGIFGDFLNHVRGEGMCKVSAEDSFYVTETCLKARLSADEGRVVELGK